MEWENRGQTRNKVSFIEENLSYALFFPSILNALERGGTLVEVM